MGRTKVRNRYCVYLTIRGCLLIHFLEEIDDAPGHDFSSFLHFINKSTASAIFTGSASLDLFSHTIPLSFLYSVSKIYEKERIGERIESRRLSNTWRRDLAYLILADSASALYVLWRVILRIRRQEETESLDRNSGSSVMISIPDVSNAPETEDHEIFSTSN